MTASAPSRRPLLARATSRDPPPAPAEAVSRPVPGLDRRERGCLTLHGHTEHLREPLDSPLRGDSRALHHLGARASESQSTEISSALPLAGFRNFKIIIKNPSRPPKSNWKPGPPPPREDSTGWPAPPPPALSLFPIALTSLSGAGAHPGSRDAAAAAPLFSLLPPRPPSPLPLHPSRAGSPAGRGHSGV